MNLTLYTNTSERIRVNKNLTNVMSLTGALRDESSIVKPVIQVAQSASALYNVNYCQVFNRYYYIDDIISIRTGISELHCSCDVLMTYANEILANSGIVRRQENSWNLYLDDGSFKVYNNQIVKTLAFPNGFTTEQFILAVAGG